MSKQKSKKNGKIFSSFQYPDGVKRKLYLRKISPDSNLYIWFYDTDGERKRVTTGTDDLFEAKARLDSFNPITKTFEESVSKIKDTETSNPDQEISVPASTTSMPTLGGKNESERITWTEFFERYHLPHYSASHKKKTVATHISSHRMFLKHFGNRLLSSFDFRDKTERAKLQLELETYFLAVKNQSSAWTARNYFATLRVMFERARDLDLIQHNIFKEGVIKQERARVEHPYFLTALQFQRVLESFDDALDDDKNAYAKRVRRDVNERTRIKVARLVAIVGFHTGARLNELIHLNWDDVDFDAKMIRISDKPDEGFVTKTAPSRRKIPMTETVFKVLHDLRFKTVAYGGEIPYVLDENNRKVHDPTRRIEVITETVYRDSSPYVFHVKGRRIRDEVASKIFKRIASKTDGIDPKLVHFHTLRHSFCTNLIRNGVPIAQVKTWAGHSRIETTLIYTHILPSDNRDLIDKLML